MRDCCHAAWTQSQQMVTHLTLDYFSVQWSQSWLNDCMVLRSWITGLPPVWLTADLRLLFVLQINGTVHYSQTFHLLSCLSNRHYSKCLAVCQDAIIQKPPAHVLFWKYEAFSWKPILTCHTCSSFLYFFLFIHLDLGGQQPDPPRPSLALLSEYWGVPKLAKRYDHSSMLWGCYRASYQCDMPKTHPGGILTGSPNHLSWILLM